MHRTRFFAMCAALIAAACVIAPGRTFAAPADDNSAAQEKERQLISVIQSDAPPEKKAIPCKQLAIYGTKAAVPALAALLGDKELSSWARTALEAIPDPAADDALRQAIDKLQGRLLIGVINSIGVRRDARSADALVAKLKDTDAAVAAAAAEALGRIGGETSAKALEPLLADAPGEVRSSAAYGCILCAERFLAEGKDGEATRLYDTVRKADLPRQRILEATRGAILARGAAGVPLLLELLRSPDKALFGLGLRVARELPGPEAADAIVAELSQLKSNRGILLLMAVADRGDAKALPALVRAAKDGTEEARVVAMRALERVGDASCVPVLLEIAVQGDADVSQAAKATLLKLPGKDVDARLAALLPEASGKVRVALIELAGQRRIEAALPGLVRGIEDADAAVHAASVAAVGAMGSEKQIADLVRALQKTQDAAQHAGIEKALMAISGRRGAACVADLMGLTKSGEAAVRVIALHALATAGGPEALAAVQSALDDKEEAVQDEAVRMLSTWANKWPEDAAVTEPLLALAKSGKKETHRILALRGYLQYLQGTKTLQDAQKLAKVKEILPLITRPEEKRSVASVLGTIPAAGALEMLVAFTAQPAVAEEACSAIVNLAAKGEFGQIPKEQRRAALQAVVDKTKNGGTKRKADKMLKAIR